MTARSALNAPTSRRFLFYRGWWIVAAGFLSHMVTWGALGWAFTVLIRPMEQDLGWSRGEIVGVLAVSNVIAGGLAAPLGPVVDRHGARLLMTLSALLGGACLMLVSIVANPWQYYLALGLGFGLAIPGLLTVGPVAAIANWFVRKRTAAFTFLSFGSAMSGMALAPFMAWVAQYADWRTGWIVLGVMLWGVVPLSWLSIRRRPEEVGLLPDGDRAGSDGEPVVLGPAEEASEKGTTWTVRQALRTRSFWLLTFALALIWLPATSIFVHMSPYVASKGFSAAAGATAVSAYGFGVLAGRFLWGFLIGRFGIHHSLVAMGFSYGVSIVAFMLPSSLVAIYVVAVVLGLSVAGTLQLQAQALPDYFGRKIVGALVGYANLAWVVTRALGPLFAAFAFDATHSYVLPFSVFAAASFVAALAFLAAAPPVHSNVPPPSAG